MSKETIKLGYLTMEEWRTYRKEYAKPLFETINQLKQELDKPLPRKSFLSWLLKRS